MMSTGPESFTLAIQSGLYEGVVETVPEGRYRIGSDFGADIVLVEDEVAPCHVIVGVAGSSVRVEALAPGVIVDGVGAVAAGSVAEMRLPIGIVVAGTRIVLARKDAQLDARSSSRASRPVSLPPRTVIRTLLGLQILAVLILMMVPNPDADAWIRSEPAGATTPSGVATIAASADPALVPARTESEAVPVTTGSTLAGARPAALSRSGAERRPTSPPLARDAAPLGAQLSSDGAADALRAEVERVGLLNVLIEAGAGVVTAGGTVEPSATARWQSVQQWFDERFAGEITLVNGVSVKAEKLPVSLGIEAVWRGEQAHLVIRGQKYLEGAVLDGGWTIQRIEAERVLVQRDGRVVAVRY